MYFALAGMVALAVLYWGLRGLNRFFERVKTEPWDVLEDLGWTEPHPTMAILGVKRTYALRRLQFRFFLWGARHSSPTSQMQNNNSRDFDGPVWVRSCHQSHSC